MRFGVFLLLLCLGGFSSGCCNKTESSKASAACAASKDRASCSACCQAQGGKDPQYQGRCRCMFATYLGGIRAL